jgi:hypothetical protein
MTGAADGVPFDSLDNVATRRFLGATTLDPTGTVVMVMVVPCLQLVAVRSGMATSPIRLTRLADRRRGGSSHGLLLIAAAGGRQAAVEDATADAAGRLKVGAVLLKGFDQMCAASRRGMMAILVVSMLMVDSV